MLARAVAEVGEPLHRLRATRPEHALERVVALEAEGDAGVADDLPVLRRVIVQHGPAGAHGLDQRRMGAADLGGVDVEPAVEQQLAVAVAVDRAGEDHPLVRQLAAPGGSELRGVGGAARP